MKIEEITIAGKNYPVAFGMRALNLICRLQGDTFGALDTEKATDVSGALNLYVSVLEIALNEGARKMNRTERYTEDDVIDMFDEDAALFGKVAELLQSATEVYAEKLGSMGKS